MKKLLIAVLILCSPLLVSCEKAETYELALITDTGNIDDGAFNQGSWEGLKLYAEEYNILYKYYKPQEQGNDGFLAAIELAVTGGAKLIAVPGFLFETPVYMAQDRWPDVSFILVDGVPNNGNFDNPIYKTGDNTVSINYAEEEAGFLAGYAIVMDGERNLGFMGGMAIPNVKRFGYGFVQGAEYAARELNLEDGSIKMYYHYTGGFIATPEIQTTAASWYNDGIDVIFACGGQIGSSVMSAAEAVGKKVIGVDIDQSGQSGTVVTSAVKHLRASVYTCVKDYYHGKFPGGEILIFTVENDGVGLSMEKSKFNSFSHDDYNKICEKLAGGSVNIVKDAAFENAADIPTKVVSVTEF